jgi:tetratricopeptide (TPR) repeat protein
MQQKLQDIKKGKPHMNLTDTTLREKCTKTYDLIFAGQYEQAKEELGCLWPGIGVRPTVESPDLFFVCGTLSRWLGAKQEIYEKSKDLLFEALRMFQERGQTSKVREAQYELSMGYFRCGAYDEARVVLDEALEGLKDQELRAKILIRKTIIEIWTGHARQALEMLDAARDAFENLSHALKGQWHGQMALALRKLASAENRSDYFDRAIIEFTAAIYHYEEAGHERYCATNLNNLAFLLYKLHRYQEVYEYLDKAQKTLKNLRDIRLLAQVDETRARVLVAEERYEEARRVIIGVVDIFERSGEQALLADALTIKATVQARLGDYEHSLHSFHRAINMAETAGALCNAGRAALSMIEEHGKTWLSEYEIYNAYRRADRLLATTQDTVDIARLRACARIMGRKLFGPSISDKNFLLQNTVRRYEARFIEQALKEEQGSITHAAHKLGLTHQSLGSILKSRHKKLRSKRKPEVSRKRN